MWKNEERRRQDEQEDDKVEKKTKMMMMVVKEEKDEEGRRRKKQLQLLQLIMLLDPNVIHVDNGHFVIHSQGPTRVTITGCIFLDQGMFCLLIKP